MTAESDRVAALTDMANSLAGVHVREVAIVLFDQFNLSELSLVIDALEHTNRIAGQSLYRWKTHAPGDRTVTSGAGLQISAGETLDQCRADIAIVIGAETMLRESNEFARHLRQLMLVGREIFLLSESAVGATLGGLIKDGSVAIPRIHEPLVEERCIEIEMAQNLFEKNGRVTTCIGGVASLDMIICMIIEHHGETLGRRVASAFMVNRVRDGGERAPSLLTDKMKTRTKALELAVQAMEGNLEDPLSLDEIAAIANLSSRQLQRMFKTAFGKSPSAAYMDIRLLKAYELLSYTGMNVTEIALASGFVSPSHFSQKFRKYFGFSPSRMARLSG